MSRLHQTCIGATFTLLAAASCGAETPTSVEANGGLTLPPGFRATVFADNLGVGRHIIVRENGDVYVSLQRKNTEHGGGVVALRDKNGDGVADEMGYFGDVAGTGIDLADDYLYYAEPLRVVRFKFASATELVPSGGMAVLVDGFPKGGGHIDKPVTLDRQGHLFVDIGVPTNACQDPDRSPNTPGRMPCPDLEGRGIYRYDAAKLNQHHPQDGTQVAMGLRQTVALEWNLQVKQLYLVMHGRDQLDLFPSYYTANDNAELPGEEMHMVTPGFNAGWPYTYWDPRRNARMIAPEYGGDGKKEAEPGKYATPLVAFPAHWAPNDLVFYDAERFGGSFAEGSKPFPDKYLHGAFIAFHGSWNRAPLPQAGYKIVFQPFKDQKPAGAYEDFATGFAGVEPLMSPGQAHHRPCGVVVAADGALFVVDSSHGRVWRIAHIWP